MIISYVFSIRKGEFKSLWIGRRLKQEKNLHSCGAFGYPTGSKCRNVRDRSLEEQ